MSSRWDALKPRGNDDDEKKRGSYNRQKRNFNSHDGSSRRQGGSHQYKDNRRRDWQPAAARTSERKPNHKPSNLDNLNEKLSLRKQQQKDGGATHHNPTWEKLTRELWELGNTTNSKEDQTTVSLSAKTQISRILQSLSRILENATTTITRMESNRSGYSIITGEQRGNALAATFHALGIVIDDKDTIREMLSWCCSIFEKDWKNCFSQGIQMTTTQAQKSIQGLLLIIPQCDKITIAKEKQCCMHLMRCCASQLPAAEETAHQVVGQILLPSLEHSMAAMLVEKDNLVESETQMVLLGVQALQSLLRIKKQSSALLAPLVNDVSTEGQEVYLVNQLRKRIFSLLQRGIQTLFTSESLAGPICLCLETALIMASDVDKTTSSKSTEIDLDSTVMEKFFQGKLHRETDVKQSSTRKCVFRLLLAYLKKQPDTSPSIGSVLLLPENPGRNFKEESRSRRGDANSHCANCAAYSVPPLSAFLANLHNSKNNNAEESELSMASLAVLVANVPWRLWLGKTPRRWSGTSNFLQRVADAIKSIILVTRCLLICSWSSTVRGQTTASAAIVDLVRATLLEIPYDILRDEWNQQQSLILSAACDLFGTLARYLVEKAWVQHPLLGRFADVFEESMGGRTTPQGTCTEMIVPARTWLSAPSSRPFMDEIFHALHKAAASSATTKMESTSVKLLRATLRTRPETVLGSTTDWKTYQDIIRTFCESRNTSLNQSGLQLLEGLLQGRKHCLPPVAECRQEEVVAFVLRVLPLALEGGSGPCRCLCLQAYGSMLGSDWFLQRRDVDINKPHMDTMLHHCLPSEQGVAVRSAACKAIGDFCGNCFLPAEQSVQLTPSELQRRDEGLKAVGQDVCVTLLQALKDGNATVRSMAVFAIGNLAQVASCCSRSDILDATVLEEACMAAFHCMDDGNDKVSGNGIRSLGHLGAVILREDYIIPFTQMEWDVDGFFQRLVCSLAQRVEATLASLVGDGKPALSWKQRSTAKKHGRVACNTLVILLKSWPVSDFSVDSIRVALDSVVKCVGSLGTSMDEKVIIAAMIVLRALPTSSLARVSGKKCLVGSALVPCISFIGKERWNQPVRSSANKLLDQTEQLCEHLLESASIIDASVVIACEEIASSWMLDLYEWMVMRNCTAQAFDTFAIALQQPSVCVPVTVERKFANRAMNLLRNEPDSDDEL